MKAAATLLASTLFASTLFASTLLGCGPRPDVVGPTFPKRPEGCDVTIYPESPTEPTTNIGPVVARCETDVANEACLRTLKDQVCKLGGDVAWGVDERGRMENGRNVFSGRAAKKN